MLIHGWGVTYAVWDKLAPLLAPYFQLIMVELPGSGAANEAAQDKPYYPLCAEALEELRLALGIEQWTILAYSTGTRVGEAYVQQYPQHVLRAVFLCPVYIRKLLKMLVQVLQVVDPKHANVVNWFISGWRLYTLLLILGFNLHRHEFTNVWMNELTLLPPEHLKRAIRELPGTGRTPFLLPTSPEVPTLFIWGLQDVVADLPTHPRPNDVFILANHSAPVLCPHLVAEVALPFLKDEVIPQNAYRTTHTLVNF